MAPPKTKAQIDKVCFFQNLSPLFFGRADGWLHFRLEIVDCQNFIEFRVFTHYMSSPQKNSENGGLEYGWKMSCLLQGGHVWVPTVFGSLPLDESVE